MPLEISTYLLSLTTSSLWPLLPDKNDQGKGERITKTPPFPFGHFPLAQRSLGWDHFHFLHCSLSNPPPIFCIKCYHLRYRRSLDGLAVKVGRIQVKEVNQVILSYFKLP